MRCLIAIFTLVFYGSTFAADFASLLGKGPSAADAWLGKPTILSGGMRDYDAGGYGFTLTYSGNSLSKITLAYFPQGKAPKTPQDVARMIGADITVGAKNKRGILELYFCSGASGIWEILLTPGEKSGGGYSVVNITPPKN